MLYTTKILPLSLITSALILAGCGSSDDKNSAPTLTGEINPIVAENTTAVSTYVANDADGDVITLSLTGDSSDLFTITQSGELSFINAPDFETSVVNSYSVIINATDDSKDKLSTSLAINVTVGDEVDTPANAVVQTVAPDYSSSEVAYITPSAQEVQTGYYIKGASDYTLSTYQADVYHIGRYGIDTIEKYNSQSPDAKVWEYTTQDNQDSLSRNPYALISLNDSKAYLIRYGSPKIWIVNPQATEQAEFKIGELDISAYAFNNSTGTPTPSAGVINDGKLYIAMQRLSDSWAPATTYIAVFDTATDEEIETNTDETDNLMGIPLKGINPLEHSVIAANDKVYVTTHSSYGAPSLSLSRIEEITPSDYSVRQVLTSENITDNAAALIKSTVIVSEEKGYFITNETSYTPSYSVKSSLHQFNPTTGEVVASNVASTGEDAINYLGLDDANFLWLSIENPSAAGIEIINTEDNSIVGDRLLTELNPSVIGFIR